MPKPLRSGGRRTITSPIRQVKDAEEVERLRAAAARPSTASPPGSRRGEIPLVGQHRGRAVSAELGRQIIDEGHARVNFAIVAVGVPMPRVRTIDARWHRVIQPGSERAVSISGGTMIGEDGVGYCSDLTRNVWTDDRPDREYPRGLCRAARGPGAPRCGLGHGSARLLKSRRPRAARSAHRVDAGYGSRSSSTAPATGSVSRSTRIPTSSRATPNRLVAGNAFSVEPGIYIPGNVGHAPRGHRRVRCRRRSGLAEHRRPSPRGPRLDPWSRSTGRRSCCNGLSVDGCSSG